MKLGLCRQKHGFNFSKQQTIFVGIITNYVYNANQTYFVASDCLLMKNTAFIRKGSCFYKQTQQENNQN